MVKKQSKTIGRRDKIDMPELALLDIDAKIDTGAYTSSLHVRQVRTFRVEEKLWVKFRLKHPSHPAYNNTGFELPVFAHKNIKNSSGKIEKRYIIKTPIVIFGRAYLTEFSLTDRSRMECPVLLGRKLLYRKFNVDVAMKDLSFKQKSRSESNDPSLK